MWQHIFSMPVMRTMWRRNLDSMHGETVKFEREVHGFG